MYPGLRWKPLLEMRLQNVQSGNTDYTFNGKWKYSSHFRQQVMTDKTLGWNLNDCNGFHWLPHFLLMHVFFV